MYFWTNNGCISIITHVKIPSNYWLWNFYRPVGNVMLLMHLHMLRFYFLPKTHFWKLFLKNYFYHLRERTSNYLFYAKNRKWLKCHILRFYFVGQKWSMSCDLLLTNQTISICKVMYNIYYRLQKISGHLQLFQKR